MFPDPTIIWRPHPSVLDGIHSPFVFDRGLWRGVLSLLVIEGRSGKRAYGVQSKCEAYLAFEEMIYSVANHGDQNGRYDGGIYLKEAETSRLLSGFIAADPRGRRPRHFSLVGTDFCYELLAFDEPTVRVFGNQDEAYAWMPAESAS